MNQLNLAFTLIVGILCLLWGIISQLNGFVRWFVPLVNSFKGVKTEITKRTFLNYRIGGILLILIGLIFIFFLLHLS